MVEGKGPGLGREHGKDELGQAGEAFGGSAQDEEAAGRTPRAPAGVNNDAVNREEQVCGPSISPEPRDPGQGPCWRG